MHPPRCDCFECLPGVPAHSTSVYKDKRVAFTRPMRAAERESLRNHMNYWRAKNREAYLADKAKRERAA